MIGESIFPNSTPPGIVRPPASLSGGTGSGRTAARVRGRFRPRASPVAERSFSRAKRPGRLQRAGRALQGLMTGIGLIGGAILKGGESVRGTATAAGIRDAGAIGTAVGSGLYGVAGVLAIADFPARRLPIPFKRGVCGRITEKRDIREPEE